MGHQYRLGNQQNADNNRVRDAIALRYSLALNSTDNSSSLGSNNRNAGLRTSADQSIHELINHGLRHGNTNMTTIIGNGGDGGDHHYPSPLILPTTINITNYNDNHSSSPASSPPPPRLFGSTLANMSSSSLGGVVGSAAAAAAANNNNNHNGGAATGAGAASTRNDDSSRSFSFKRSRSPDQFSRGESSGQGSQDAGTSTRRRTIAHTMFSSTLSTPWRNYSSSSSVIPNIFDQHMMNQATAAGAGPSSTNTTQSRVNSLFEDDSPNHSNSTYNELSDIDFNRNLFSPRQDYQSNNFTSQRFDPPFASASALSFYTSAATGGSLGTTQVPTPFDRYNNSMSSSAAGGSSSSFSYSRGTGGGENVSTNNNNNDSLSRIEREVAALDQTINIRQYITVLPSGRINQFVAPTLVPVRSGSLVPPLPHVRASRGNINRIFISNSPELRTERNRLRDEINSSLQHLRNGGSVRTEDLMILDYSIVLNLLDSQERIDQLNGTDDWPFELMATMEAQFGSVNVGLTEEEIIAFIGQETFQTRPGATSTQDQTCTICQEDYEDGEDIGRIDCMHIYHLGCITQWLKQKNTCPICKRIALDIDDEDY